MSSLRFVVSNSDPFPLRSLVLLRRKAMDDEWDSQVGQFVERGPRLFEGLGVRTLSEESSGYMGMGWDDSFYGFYGAV